MSDNEKFAVTTRQHGWNTTIDVNQMPVKGSILKDPNFIQTALKYAKYRDMKSDELEEAIKNDPTKMKGVKEFRKFTKLSQILGDLPNYSELSELSDDDDFWTRMTKKQREYISGRLDSHSKEPKVYKDQDMLNLFAKTVMEATGRDIGFSGVNVVENIDRNAKYGPTQFTRRRYITVNNGYRPYKPGFDVMNTPAYQREVRVSELSIERAQDAGRAPEARIHHARVTEVDGQPVEPFFEVRRANEQRIDNIAMERDPVSVPGVNRLGTAGTANTGRRGFGMSEDNFEHKDQKPIDKFESKNEEREEDD